MIDLIQKNDYICNVKIVIFWLVLVPWMLYAQPFAPLGAQWTYQINRGCCGNTNLIDFVTWSVEKDTILKNQNCRMIVKNGLQIEGFSDTMFVYQNGLQVFYYDFYSQDFILLYDFSKQKNESWAIRSGSCEFNIMVDSISNIQINGHNLKQLYISSNNSDYNGVIIEKIGFLPRPQPNFALYCYGLVAYNYYNGLRCYQDPEIGFYDFQIAPML
jgi:hypothetical protein